MERLNSAAVMAYQRILQVGVEGAGPWKGSATIADEQLGTHPDPEEAIGRIVSAHARVTTGSGFLTGLGGLMTLPVAVPTDLVSLWVVQGRMVGAIAHLRGYDVSSEDVRSLLLVSMIGSSGTEVLAKAGIDLANRSVLSALRRVPGRVLIDINKRVGFRLVTKAGTTGVVNLTRIVPVAGGVVGGSVNFVSTRTIANYAKGHFPTVEPE